MKRRRQLSEEERALWTGVTRSIAPLHGPLHGSQKTAEPAGGEETVSVPRPPAVRHAPPLAKQSPPLAPLGRRLRQRVGRGREPIDARLDLHGMTQREAHAALRGFLHRAQADGAKIVIVVTGKGTGKSPATSENDVSAERGVLKRQVPLWLALPEFRSFVVGFEDAHAFNGGQGALYVRLRRG